MGSKKAQLGPPKPASKGFSWNLMCASSTQVKIRKGRFFVPLITGGGADGKLDCERGGGEVGWEFRNSGIAFVKTVSSCNLRDMGQTPGSPPPPSPAEDLVICSAVPSTPLPRGKRSNGAGNVVKGCWCWSDRRELRGQKEGPGRADG